VTRWVLVTISWLVVPATVIAGGADGTGWTILFDGSSAEAWRCYKGGDIASAGWVMEGGALKTVAGAESRCDIISRKQYRDFEMELEWRVSPGGNSGIFFGVAETDGPAWHTGPEYQVLDDSRHPDGKDPKTSAAALYGLVAARDKSLRPVGEYNRSRLVVRGQHVEHWLNGKKVAEYELDSGALRKLIAASKFGDKPRFAREREGHVALQHHGEEVWYRDVRIRPLAGGH
jgi:hypothetical protein